MWCQVSDYSQADLLGIVFGSIRKNDQSCKGLINKQDLLIYKTVQIRHLIHILEEIMMAIRSKYEPKWRGGSKVRTIFLVKTIPVAFFKDQKKWTF